MSQRAPSGDNQSQPDHQSETSDHPFQMVVASANNGTIGNKDALPWRLSRDLQRFKRLTMGHLLVMGRRTYESIGRPLPGRTTVVLTRNPEYRGDGILVATQLDQVLKHLQPGQIPFVVGGAEVYRWAWPRIGVLHWTRVLASVAGDTQLAPLDLHDFKRVTWEHVPADEKNDWPSDYECWVRNTCP